MRVGEGGAIDSPLGQGEQPGDQHDRTCHEEHLVPSALVGHDASRSEHGIDRTAIAD